MGSRCPLRAERWARTIHPSSGAAQNYKHVELLKHHSKLWHSSNRQQPPFNPNYTHTASNHGDEIVKQPHGTRVHAIFCQLADWNITEREREMTFKNIYQNVSVLWTALFHCVWASVCERVCVWGWASLFLDRGKSRRGIRQVWCVYEAVAPRRMTHRDVSGASQWPCTLSVINSLCLVLGWPTKLSPKMVTFEV